MVCFRYIIVNDLHKGDNKDDDDDDDDYYDYDDSDDYDDDNNNNNNTTPEIRNMENFGLRDART